MNGEKLIVKLADSKKRTKCKACPLRALNHLREFTSDELDFIDDFKTGELNSDKGSTVLVEGSHSAHLFTILSGWAFRYKMLEDGRRQILNYVMPGDLIGLQGSVAGEMDHSIEALTNVTLCVFERDRLMQLFSKHPDLGYDLTWIAAREEQILDEHLLSVGRRNAIERIAYLLSFLYYKVSVLSTDENDQINLPITQQHVADTLGLSIVHTNKTIKKLVEKKLVKWLDRGCIIEDVEGLAAIASWEPDTKKIRPFL